MRSSNVTVFVTSDLTFNKDSISKLYLNGQYAHPIIVVHKLVHVKQEHGRCVKEAYGQLNVLF